MSLLFLLLLLLILPLLSLLLLILSLLLRAGLSAARPQAPVQANWVGAPLGLAGTVLPHQVPLYGHLLVPMGLGAWGAATVSLCPWGAQGRPPSPLREMLCAPLCPLTGCGAWTSPDHSEPRCPHLWKGTTILISQDCCGMT